MKTTVPAVALSGPAGCAEAPGPMTRLAAIARTPTRASNEVLRMYILHLSRHSSESRVAAPARLWEIWLERLAPRAAGPSRETNDAAEFFGARLPSSCVRSQESLYL